MNFTTFSRDFFKSIKIPWKLTGDLQDKNINGTNIGGVYDTNYRTIIKYNETFPGLQKYLVDPLEYTIFSVWYDNFIKNRVFEKI